MGGVGCAMRVSKIQKQPKAIDITYLVNGALLAIGLAILFGIWRFYDWGSTQLQYAEAGRTACAQSINVSYLASCNARFDGPACTHESQTRIERYVHNIDNACIPFMEDKAFVVDDWGGSKYPPIDQSKGQLVANVD